jgi:hypothetical protein
MDLAVEYHGHWDIIEIKLLRDRRNFEAVKEEGIRQTLAYRERFTGKTGPDNPPGCYLIIFDRRTEKPSWEERLRWLPEEKLIVVCC